MTIVVQLTRPLTGTERVPSVVACGQAARAPRANAHWPSAPEWPSAAGWRASAPKWPSVAQWPECAATATAAAASKPTAAGAEFA